MNSATCEYRICPQDVGATVCSNVLIALLQMSLDIFDILFINLTVC